ncbi:MAG: hypothetical protein RLZZ546_2075, partial [Bacteroidota bacterium]
KALANLGIPQLEPLKKKSLEIDSIFANFTDEDASKVKSIEKITNHDVKAVEYFLREKFIECGLESFIEFIHFGLTSQDVNNTSFPLMMKDAHNHALSPLLDQLLNKIRAFADSYPNTPMLAHTHGQPASPTTFKKEMMVFVERLELQIQVLYNLKFKAKFGGATGNLNAHKASFPNINWINFSNDFVSSLGLERLTTTTQISHYDQEAEYFQCMIRINNILIDFCRDIWTYISMSYIKQKTVKNEVGSSAMPHKVNPIDFENAEGNFGIANALFAHLAEKLPISRLQRDLTDSTVLRNIGVPFAHCLISYSSILKGIEKLSLNVEKINEDLNSNIAVIAEAIQNILRRENIDHPYELLKGLTRGQDKLTKSILENFIDTLPIHENVKSELKNINPHNYIGYAD